MTEHNAAKNRKQINVTARDIELGIPNNTESCPVARAAKRAFKTNVRVNHEILLADKGGAWMTRYPLPSSVSDFIEDFDASCTGSPFKFYIEV